MNIIGISGRRTDLSSAGSGKDEVAKILARKHAFVVVSLADPFKRIAMQLYDLHPDQLWGSRKEEPDVRYPREHGPFVRDHVHVCDDKDTWRCACCGHWAVTEAPESGLIHYVPKNAPPCYLSGRFVARWIGTEAGRTMFEDTWTRLAINTARELLVDSTGGRAHDYDKYRSVSYHPQIGLFARNGEYDASHGDRIDGVVIPDVRWPAGNEGKAVKDAGGRLWLVERPGTSQTGTAVAKHASETQPIPDDAFDAILPNTGTLADLERVVDDMVESFKEAS